MFTQPEIIGILFHAAVWHMLVIMSGAAAVWGANLAV